MSGWLDRPREQWLRKALFQVHLWTGLASGLYAIAIGVTGSLLMVHQELRPIERRLSAAPASRITPDEAIERASAAFPGAAVSTLVLPWDERDVYQGWAGAQGFTIHPQTGAVEPMASTGFWRMVERIHSNFTFGRTGRVWVGIGGIAMIAMGLTGLVIWWPGRSLWRRSLGVEWRAGWKRINWDLHTAAGFWTAGFMLALSVTGIYFTWPAVYRSAIASVLPLARPPMMAPPAPPPDGALPIPIAQLIPIAEAAVPGRRVSSFYAGGRGVTFTLPESVPSNMRATNQLLIDRYTGAVLARDLYVARSAGDQTLAWVAPLHAGTFADGSAWRYAVKALYFAGGLAMPFLFVTGFLMWWNRVVRKSA